MKPTRKPYRDCSKDFFYPNNDGWWSLNGVVAIVIVTIKVGFVLLMLLSVFWPKAKEIIEAIRPTPTGLNQWNE